MSAPASIPPAPIPPAPIPPAPMPLPPTGRPSILRPSVPAGPGARRTVVMISASIGAGHDGAARELTRRLTAGGLTVQRHDFLDMLPAGLGDALRTTYAQQLRYAPATWGWLLRAAAGPRFCEGAGALAARAATARILAAAGPDTAAVVSTYPLASQVLGRLRGTGRLDVPAIAFMTDPSIHPLCVAHDVDLHLTPGARAADDIRAVRGARAEVVGPVVDPGFRPTAGLADAYEARTRLGLPAVERLAVVVAGSWGVGDVEATARDVAAAGSVIPVVVCGRNEPLRRRLSAAGGAIALGWVDDMPSLLRAADVVVHNAGGLSSLEAMASGVPVISYRCLPGHGTANAAALMADGLSPWPRSPGELVRVLHRALDGGERQCAAYARLADAPDAAALIAELAGFPATAVRIPA
jgi:UDP-N-acetylglucosamine:LPS N-acetylglucosamine transferase